MSTFSFRSSGVPKSARVVCFRGEESISGLFWFDVHLVAPDDDCTDLDFDAAIGAKGTLTVDSGDLLRGAPADYHGVLGDIELVHALEGRALLRVTLVPRLFALTNTYHSRMWTKKAIPDVLSDVFQGGGLAGGDVSRRLSGEHPTEEHVTEYHESDYDFASRWMEREGIYYFFDHSDDVDKLVLADDKSVHESCQDAPVRYHPVSSEDVSSGQSWSTFRQTKHMQPAAVELRDYDYTKPALDVSNRQDVSSLPSGDVVMFSGRFFTPSDAQRLAKLRAEEHLAEETVYTASGTVVGVRPGYTFELFDHPTDALNQVYLVTSARHEGSQETSGGMMEVLVGRPLRHGYHVSITAISADVQFRRRGTAAWPRIAGFEHGTIDGPADSEYGQIDDQGRYLVKPFFDESGLSDGKATTRLRMMQPHGGNPEGFHFPLRKGTEVIIAFHGGDPDRPFIAGFVPDTQRPSPVVAANHTQNVVQTGGLTRIEIEDQKGKQYVWIKTPPKDTYLFLGQPHAPATHYTELHTQGDCLFDIGGNQDIDVGGKLTETVQGDVTETYSTSQTSTITGPQRTTVNQPVEEFYQSTQHTKVHGLRLEDFNSGHLTMVGGGLREEEYQSGQHTTVQGGVTETYSGGLTRTVVGSTTERYVGSLDVTATGAVTQTYPAGVKQTYGPYTANWAKLTWIAGPVSINAPNWVITSPVHHQFFSSKSEIGPTVFKSGVLSNSTYAFYIALYGLYRVVTGVKLDMTGIKATVVGPSIERGGFKLELGILKTKITGIAMFV